MTRSPLTYTSAGVDRLRAAAVVDAAREFARSTERPEVIGDIGGFAGLFALAGRFREPLLVSSSDGVGTKLKLACRTGRHRGIGRDLVAMCVNDILCTGAEPLFFLDYFATGRLSLEVARDVLAGIAEGCSLAGCALLGGETAEMPGVYDGGLYDLAGFAVGAVERARLVDPARVRPGDVVLGLLSSGLHANGFSLASRALLDVQGRALEGPAIGTAHPDLAAELLEPTRIYVKPVLQLLDEVDVHGIAHITGGGLLGNVPRALPIGCRAVLDRNTWPEPAILAEIGRAGVDDEEMQRTFNLGLGMVLVLSAAQAEQAVASLKAKQIAAAIVGQIEPGPRQCALVGRPRAEPG